MKVLHSIVNSLVEALNDPNFIIEIPPEAMEVFFKKKVSIEEATSIFLLIR